MPVDWLALDGHPMSESAVTGSPGAESVMFSGASSLQLDED